MENLIELLFLTILHHCHHNMQLRSTECLDRHLMVGSEVYFIFCDKVILTLEFDIKILYQLEDVIDDSYHSIPTLLADI